MKRKYLQYVLDPVYRQMYRHRVFYNVNLDVPENVLAENKNQVLDPDSMAFQTPSVNQSYRENAGNVMEDQSLSEDDLDIQNQSYEQRSQKSMRSASSVGTEPDQIVQNTENTTRSNVIIKEFRDPLNPSRRIRVEKSIVTQLVNDGSNPEQVFTNTVLRIQKADSQGSILHKEFALDNEDPTNRYIRKKVAAIPNKYRKKLAYD